MKLNTEIGCLATLITIKVLVKQESTRKNGFTITQEEEQLRSQLESIQAEIETPTQFKGRLNEVLSQVSCLWLAFFFGLLWLSVSGVRCIWYYML